MKCRGSFASNWFVEIAGGRVMERTCRPEQLTQNPLKGLRNQNNEIEKMKCIIERKKDGENISY